MTIVLICAFLAGVSLLLYPTLSDRWNSRTQSRAVTTYDAAVAEMDEADYTAYFEAAEAFNEKLAELGSLNALTNTSLLDDEYWDLLDITGTGMMGYVTIDRINLQLPIYHGTDSGVLQIGVGHLEGSSLPVGGESTHSVISAHRGLPSARLFTDIDQLEVGDTFTITTLDQVFTYRVDLISIVLPTEIEYLYIEDGEDYCTLMTCTPYGVNTHRLLVRGVRTTNADEALLYVTADAYKIEPMRVAPVFAVPMAAVLVIWLAVRTGKRKKSPTKK
ncbi:MAG: class C sortase [Clostridiales bacterium]|nr:class C sortase [Clostridiales bacterium]